MFGGGIFKRKKVVSQATKDYFDEEDDEPGGNKMLYPLHDEVEHDAIQLQETAHDDIDPLDLYMLDVEKDVASNIEQNNTGYEIVSHVDDMMEYDDVVVATYNKKLDENEEEIANKKKKIEPLAAIDHSAIEYHPFNKCFYKTHPDVQCLSASDVSKIRADYEVSVTSCDHSVSAICPVTKFEHMGFPKPLVDKISSCGYAKPTAIQAQSIPIILSGIDVIALAKTGSGKTCSYVWPLIVHVLDQPNMRIGDGPIGLILVPTRELASQIYYEIKKFGDIFKIRVACVYGGTGKYEMQIALQEAPEIVVATPGRLIDLLSVGDKHTNLRRCTFVVLDEADRMFEMGFEYQMKSILRNVRPDRQTILFSATMRKCIEGFAMEILNSNQNQRARIVVGSIGQANSDIQQLVECVDTEEEKFEWLVEHLSEWVLDGKVLIFVASKEGAEVLRNRLQNYFAQFQYLNMGRIDRIHGDILQQERDEVIRRFKVSMAKDTMGGHNSSLRGEKACFSSVLIATDVASRGLDIKDVRTVLNYDVPKNMDTYVHRIGRTGRMGVNGVVPGTAYTLILQDSKNLNDTLALVAQLLRNGQNSHIKIPAKLMQMVKMEPKTHGGSRVGSRFGGPGNGGIGSGNVNRTMTSAMLAETYPSKGPSKPANVKSYDSRASHVVVAQSGASVGSLAASSSSIPVGDVVANTPKRSRFSSAAPVLPGFVAASKPLIPTVSPQVPAEVQHTSVASSNSTGEKQAKKRSRWDR